MTWSAPRERTRSDVPCAAYAGDFRAERFGDLDGERANAAGSAVDQDLLPGLSRAKSRSPMSAVIPASGTAAACSNVRFAGFGSTIAVWGADVLGERGVGLAEYLVAGAEPGDTPADRLHATGEVRAPDPRLGSAEAEHHAGRSMGRRA